MPVQRHSQQHLLHCCRPPRLQQSARSSWHRGGSVEAAGECASHLQQQKQKLLLRRYRCL